MSLDNYENAPYASSSPLQLLIYLTVGVATFVCLFLADALEWSAPITIFGAAAMFTFLRGTKKLFVVWTTHGQFNVKKRVKDGQLNKQVRKLFDVYFSMLLLSLFCYGVGVALHIFYHFIF